MNLTVAWQELAHTGITVNTVSPGIIVPWRQFFTMFLRNGDGERKIGRLKTVLLMSSPLNTVGRLGTIEEIGKFFAYL